MRICKELWNRNVLHRLVLLAGAIWLLASCDASNDAVLQDEPDETHNTVTVSLHFTADYTGSVTRAPELSNDDNTNEENRIDIEGEDYYILIFKETTAADGTTKMVFQERFVPLMVNVVANTEEKERLYTLQGLLPVSSELKTGEVAQEKLAIMVLANWHSFGSDYDGLSLVVGETTLTNVVEQSRHIPYMLPSAPWQPYKNGERGIPMCGVKKFEIKTTDIQPGAVLNIADKDDPVMMLRAVAKIEIIDNLYEGQRDSECGVKVASVSRYNKTGTLICDMKENPNWYVETEQVRTPTLPYVTPEQGSELEMFPAGNNEDGKPVYAAYVPEFDMSELKPGDVLRPAIKLQIKKPGKDTELLGYIVDIADYADKTTPKVTEHYYYLLRNHIYRFELTGSPENPKRKLTINYTVCPWDKRTAGDIRFE